MKATKTLSYHTAAVVLAPDTANQVLVTAPGAAKQIWLHGVGLQVDTGAGTIALQDEDDTVLTGAMAFADNGGLHISPSGLETPIIKVATNKALEADTVTCSAAGWIAYAIVSEG